MENDIFNIRKSIFTPLFDKEIKVLTDKKIKEEYIIKCENHLKNICKSKIEYILKRIKDYYMWWIEEEISEEEVAELKKIMPNDVNGKEILNFISEPEMYIFEPKDPNIMVYTIFCNSCAWEKEHGLEIIIRDDVVVYVGFGGSDFYGWEDIEEYETDY